MENIVTIGCLVVGATGFFIVASVLKGKWFKAIGLSLLLFCAIIPGFAAWALIAIGEEAYASANNPDRPKSENAVKADQIRAASLPENQVPTNDVVEQPPIVVEQPYEEITEAPNYDVGYTDPEYQDAPELQQ